MPSPQETPPERGLGKVEKDPMRRLVVQIAGRLDPGSLVTIIHCATSEYLRFLHDLVVRLLMEQRTVHILDFRRGMKNVYLQQALRRAGVEPSSCLSRLRYTVILEEDHALSQYQRLYHGLPKGGSPVVLLLDPTALLGRQIGSVKQAAAALQLQYEAAHLLAQRGYAVVVTDSGSRDPHRAECLVPSQLSKNSTLILRFLPRRIIVEGTLR